MGAVVVPLAARPAAWVVAMVGEVDIDGGSRWAIGRRAPLELLFPSNYPPVPVGREVFRFVSLTDSCKFILCSVREHASPHHRLRGLLTLRPRAPPSSPLLGVK